MPKKGSKAKVTRVPGGFDETANASMILGNVSTEVQRDTNSPLNPEVEYTNPFNRSPNNRTIEVEPMLLSIDDPGPILSSTPKPSEGSYRPSGFNIGEEARNIVNRQSNNTPLFSYLTTITGPLRDLEIQKECYSDATINLIACQSLTTLDRLGNEAGRLIGRVMKAVELGSAYTGRTIRMVNGERSHLSRTEERSTFKNVLSLLETLLKEVVRYDDDKRTAYALESENLFKLEEELKNLRRQALDDICDVGGIIPSIPVWGKADNRRDYWVENDFEVLGACYRLETEQFLAQLAKYHKFNVTTKPNAAERSELSNPESELSKNKESNIKPLTEEIPSNKEKVAQDRKEFEKEQGYRADSVSASMDSISQAIRPRIFTKTRTWGGHPTDRVSGRRMKELFPESTRPQNNYVSASRPDNQSTDKDVKRQEGDPNAKRNAKTPDSGPPDDDDDGDNDPRKGRRSGKAALPRGGNLKEVQNSMIMEPQFDNRLKVEIIPTWDGDPDTLGKWVLKINRLADRSETVRKQLGYLVPARLSGAAETWYYSLSLETRMELEEDWPTLRDGIGSYYMNRTYMNRQKIRANKASYRDMDNSKETPSEYFVRKVELLSLVYEYSDSELIHEVMSTAPAQWVSILTPHLYENIEDFQLAIKFHEETLLRLDFRNRMFKEQIPSRNPFNQYRQGRTNLVGWSKETLNPPFPKDDSNVSPKATPEDKGARPCRHCGSGKHWDPECRYSKKGEKRARVNKVSISEEDLQAQNDYDNLYFEEISDAEEDQDFH